MAAVRLTPYDEVIEKIVAEGYHNHRRETHSDIVSVGLFHDLLASCPPLREDYLAGTVNYWVNVSAPGGRNRFLDLFVGEPGARTGLPDFRTLRIGVEHKSVITAHRNKTNRYDDLMRTLGAIHPERPQAVLAATVLVGTAPKVLNVPDYVRKMRLTDFEMAVKPRLSTGDVSLWTEFAPAISRNRPDDATKTVELFRTIPTRAPGHTHTFGYDFLQLVPVFVNNVDPPSVDRENSLGIDIDEDYARMLHVLSSAYSTRWHLI